MKDKKNGPSFPWHLAIAGVLSLVVLLGFYWVGANKFSTEEWNEFGDFIAGAAGVIITTFTFLALLYTIHIQSTELALSRNELSLTRDELALNRGEIAKSGKALRDQVETIKVQNFERTLFESLNFLSKLSEQFEWRSPVEDAPRTGVSAFFAMYHQIGHPSVALGALGVEDGDQIGNHAPLGEALDRLRTQLAPYYRTLYNIYRYLDESEFADEVYYNRIIRAQIPDHALAILFYNSLTPRGLRFQKYIEKYAILDNLPPELLFNPHHRAVLDNLPTPNATEAIGEA
ncbi:putative phage abortive infection protein [Qipengyuania flava]|uniref:putative phage abortive infection protein n=1 Tax=Qipengyuania flava TaxID=192812 RepID=UPI00273DBCCA|nr:putative phage abortive infection protein [Qipengyuania flava]